MAFLCPVRIRSQKAKKKSSKEAGSQSTSRIDPLAEGPGRITGSSSIETLVRVGLEKQCGSSTGSSNGTLMVVLHDFTPCVDDELEVKRGDVVSFIYREHDWAYVVQENREGFIPFSYLTELSGGSDHSPSGTSPSSLPASQNAEVFYKDSSAHGQYVVLYSFQAVDENDLSVERGELLTVLNKEDPDWFWVVRGEQEGFVPSAFVFPFSYVNKGGSRGGNLTSPQTLLLPGPQQPSTATVVDPPPLNLSDANKEGTEMVMLYDYKAQAPDDLSVRRGDWVYADMNHQTVEGWLWAYAPKHKKYGFIPKAYARPPAMTSL